jgi:hypothetical protein
MAGIDVRRAALMMWPGLDRTKLARTRGRPDLVARLVARRTALPYEVILGMLRLPPRQADHQAPEARAVVSDASPHAIRSVRSYRSGSGAPGGRPPP